MAAQALAGDRPRALKTYAQCQAMLQDEFGIQPARETAVLAENIGQDRLPKVPGEGRIAPGSSPAISPPAGHPEACLPFEGRAEEHKQLVATFRQAGQEGARVMTVIGASGVGKTRLVNAFLEWATLDSPGVEIWSGRAFEMGGRLPYQPVIEALRERLEQENAPEDLLEDVWLAELSHLMPELRARYPDLPPPMTGDASFVRSRLFSAMAILGSALAGRRPAIFTLDDLQWAGDDTLAMIHYMAQHWAKSGTPILLLLTVRQESFAADARLREWLAQLGRDVPAGRLLLDSLNAAAVRRLVSRLAAPETAAEATNAFGEWLWAETGGLPFFIDALLQMLVEQGILAVRETEVRHSYDFADILTQVRSGEQVQVPPGVRQAILSRFDRLSEKEANLLLAASVLGRECSFETLCRVAGIGETVALEAVEALLNGNFLAESRAARRPYTLAHDYIREVVYNESHEARRRLFHRRALIILEAARAPAAECAYHALASQLDEPAFRYSLAAGDEAFRSYAMQECLAHYDKACQVARRMLDSGVAIASQSLLQLYQNRGRALELLQETQAARDNYQAMRALAIDRQDKALELAALTAQCIIHATYTSLFNPPLARELGNAALDLSRELNDRAAEASALWGLMLAELYSAGDSQIVMVYGGKSLSIARELGLQELMGHVLNDLCWPYVAQMQLKAARKANGEAQVIWRTLGNLPMLAESYTMGLFLHFFEGKHTELLAAATEALHLSRSIGSRLHQGNALRFMAEVHSIQGRFGETLANLQASLALSEESGHAYSKQTDYRFLATFYLLAGALDQAEQWADTLFALRESIIPTFQAFFLASIARVKIACGKFLEGEAILDQVLEEFDWQAPWSHSVIPIFIADMYLQLALGKPERIFASLQEQVRKFRQAGFRYSLAEELWLRGKAWLALDKLEQAREALVSAKAVAEENGERTFLWQILATLSELESISGKQSEAEKLREQALEVIDYIAEHAGSDELRDSFLAQPDVARLLIHPAAGRPSW